MCVCLCKLDISSSFSSQIRYSLCIQNQIAVLRKLYNNRYDNQLYIHENEKGDLKFQNKNPGWSSGYYMDVYHLLYILKQINYFTNY